MNWFQRLFGAEPPIRTVIRCPAPNCGWEDPVIVTFLACVMTDGQKLTTDMRSRLCRCPMCQTLYVATKDGARRCGPEPLPVSPQTIPARVDERVKQPNFPPLPEDMLRGFNSREPR